MGTMISTHDLIFEFYGTYDLRRGTLRSSDHRFNGVVH